MTVDFEGWLYPAEGGRRPVRASADATGALIVDEPGGETRRFEPGSFEVSDRVGNTLRRILLADGALLETGANAVIDAAFAAPSRLVRWRARLERSGVAALVAVLLLGSLAAGALLYGAPTAAERIAPRMPVEMLDMMSDQALDVMDRTMLEPTTLTPRRQAEVGALFDRSVIAAAYNFPTEDYRLRFRAGGRLGANAFALPNGVVVVTDELVALAVDPNELVAVFAHEIGHVERRHAVRGLLQSGAVALVLLALSGDVSMVSQLGVVLPGMLAEAGYSRAFEREADTLALDALRRLNIDPRAFANILDRLEAQCETSCDAGWLATHPSTKDRLGDITAR